MTRPKVNINVSGGAGVRNKHRGTSEERPVEGMLIGFEYFDTDLGYPIWWSGDTSDDKSGWVNALGENIPPYQPEPEEEVVNE